MQKYLQTEAVSAALNQTSGALSSLTTLKKICDHPALLTDKAAGLAMCADKSGHAHRAGGYRRRSDSSVESFDDAPDSDLDDFIVDTSDDEAASTASKSSDEEDSSDDDEDATRRRKRNAFDEDEKRAQDIDKNVNQILQGLGEFDDLSGEEVLDRLHAREDRDSCKSVCFGFAQEHFLSESLSALQVWRSSFQRLPRMRLH